MPKRKVLVTALIVPLVAILGMLLLPGTASATQNGLQQVWNTGSTGFNVQFNCDTEGINPGNGGWGGEGLPQPNCGFADGSREPNRVWIGPGWCATRAVWDDDTNPISTLGYQNLAAGGSGHWFQLWQSSSSMSYWAGYSTRDYHNSIKPWTGNGCPTTGGAWVDDNPPGVTGVGMDYTTNPYSDGYQW